MAALLVVVIAGASLGSAFRPSSGQAIKPGIQYFDPADSGAVGSLERFLFLWGGSSTQVGGWTGYAPLNGYLGRETGTIHDFNAAPQMLRKMRQGECASLKKALARAPKTFRQDLKRSMHSVCRKHR